MKQNIGKRAEELYQSLQKNETFSKEIQEQIEGELKKLRKEAIEFNKKNNSN